MKKSYLVITVVAMFAISTFTNCGGSKKVTSVTDQSAMKSKLNEEAEIEISTPCSSSEYSSTKELIRATGIGESMDQQMAKRMARSAALEDLGTKIKVSVNGLIADYYKSTKQDMTEDLKRRFEGGTDLVIKESVSNYRTVCEKFTRVTTTKNYKCYMAIEIGTDETAKQIHKKLTDEQILRIDYDFEKFRNKFNQEMQKADKN